MPGASLPHENWFDKIWLDKLIHAGIFFILVFLWFLAIIRKTGINARKRTILLWITLIAILYGIGIEFIQKYLVAGRSFERGDIMADTFGCIIGVIYCNKKYIKK